MASWCLGPAKSECNWDVCVCSPLPKINVEIVYRRQAAIENAQFRHNSIHSA